MSRICPLFSGSDGNSTYISSGGTAILIDAGASFKQLSEAIGAAGGAFSELCAIAITHEHTDHIRGLKVLLKNIRLPIIASKETLEALIASEYIPSGIKTICAEGEIDMGDIVINRFKTSHDCLGSSGYTVAFSDLKRFSVCTDTGIVTDEIRMAVSGSDVVLFEANHDIEMLKRGPYPPQLKLRILSDTGHLSNNACAAELPRLLKNGTTRFILGHLSKKNNLPMLARSAANAALSDIGARDGEDYILTTAKPAGNGVTFI